MAQAQPKYSEELILQHMARLDTLMWVDINKIKFREGMNFTLVGHRFQADMLCDNSPRQCTMKGAQIGLTSTWMLKIAHGMSYGKYPQGAIYFFPTSSKAEEFCKSRFDPLLSINPCLRRLVQSTNAATIKQIANSWLYFRGARMTHKVGGATSGKESSINLKETPADVLVFDECDEMKPTMIELAKTRMFHSKVRQEAYLSTPTVPDWGIDRLYQASDMRVWMIKCLKCNHETCLELEFPECLGERTVDDKMQAFKKCMKCGEEIFTRDGNWIAQQPSKAEDMVGWWISSLNSYFVQPTEILNSYRNPPEGGLSEVYNSLLGMPYIDTENRLTASQVFNRCGKDPMQMENDGPCCAGVDVGKDLHVTIGYKPGRDTIKVIKMARISNFNDLHDLSQRFNIRCMVIDKYPETHKVRDFRKQERFPIFMCGYQEGKQRGPTAWDEKNREIHGNRTELLDASHNIIANTDRLELPRKTEEVEVYANHMSNAAKVLETDDDTGARLYKYRKLGADHYRHSTNYLMLAAERVGTVNSSKLVGKFFQRRKRGNFMTA